MKAKTVYLFIGGILISFIQINRVIFKITKNLKKFLIILAIATPLVLSFIFILNATETPTPPEGCPFSLPGQGNLDGTLLRNNRTGEFIEKIQANEGNVITGATVTERVLQIAHVAVKCEVTLGSCGNVVKTISWLAGVPNLTRIVAGENSGRIDGDAGTHIRDIAGEQRREICNINCGRSDCLKPCTEEASLLSASEKRSAVYEKLRNEIRDRGRRERWPELWANLLQPGDGIVVYQVNSEPGGSHYAIFLGWDNEERGKAKVIEGAWATIVKEGTIHLKQAGGRRPLIKITRPE